jgi:hypothetical protein
LVSLLSAVIADRIKICRDAFRVVFKNYPRVFGTDYSAVYYDLQSILFTINPIESFEPGRPLELTVDSEADLPGNLSQITMVIKHVKEDAQKTKLDDLSYLINAETLERDRSVLNFIELAVNQYPMFAE